MNPTGNAFIYYQANEYSTASEKLMGRHAASEAFLTSWTNYTPFDEIGVMVRNSKDKSQFEDFFARQNRSELSKGRVIDPLNMAALKEFGCLYLPDPNIIRYAHQRQRVNRYNHSLCGVTHTLASQPTLEMIASYLTAPIYAWDALICTSKVVQDSVKKLLEQKLSYLSDRFDTPLKLTLPQLPIIPLGTEIDRSTSEQRQTMRREWRDQLGIDAEAVVFLFYGRLSFHAKANPFIMYRALQEVAKKTDKKIVLLQAGWFANESIESIFKSTAQEWAPDVTSVFVDGRLPKVRKEIRHASDIFISLSDNIQETFGLTPIEAMAAGLPSVVSDWNGYKDTVRHGEHGYRIPTTIPSINDSHLPMTEHYEAGLINYDHYIGQVSHSVAVDLPKCVEACYNLVENPNLRQKLGEQAKKYVAEEFAWEKIIYRYVDLFRELNEIRIGSSHIRLDDQIDPVFRTPFERFSSYPTNRLGPKDQFFRSSEQAEEELTKIYENQMFSFGGLDSLSLAQQILQRFPLNKGIYLKELPAELGTIHQKDRVVSFLLKTGLIQKL